MGEDLEEENLIAHLHPELIHVTGGFVPSKNVNYKMDKDGNVLSFFDRPKALGFERALRAELKKALTVAADQTFPTKEEVHVGITFALHSEKDYPQGDIDNKAKTILDALKGPVYIDDHQVKILYVKKMKTTKEEDWCLFAVKILRFLGRSSNTH